MNNLTDFGKTKVRFLLHRGKHTAHGSLDLVHGIVNDVVVTDLNAFVLGKLSRTSIGSDIEPDDDGAGRPGR